MLNKLEAIGRWSRRRPRRALALWLGFVAACLAFGAVTGTRSLDNGATGESARGYDMGDRYGLWGFPTEAVLVQGGDQAAAATQIRARVARLRGLTAIQGPQRSRNGRATLVYFQLERDGLIPRLDAIVSAVQRATPKARLGLTGDISVDRARSDQNDR